MDDTVQELNSVLQILALPVTGQVGLIQDDCSRVERLVGSFSVAHHAIRSGSDIPITAGRARALAQLDERLARLSGPSAPSLCSEFSLRQNIEWQQIRRMARESLVRFGWTLEVPQRWSRALGREQSVVDGIARAAYGAVNPSRDHHLAGKESDK